MGLSRYLVAILDLCKLGGFPTGVEFQQINTCYNTPLQTYWRRIVWQQFSSQISEKSPKMPLLTISVTLSLVANVFSSLL